MRKRKVSFETALTLFNIGCTIRHPNYPDNPIIELFEDSIELKDHVRKQTDMGIIHSRTLALFPYSRSLKWIQLYE